MGQYWSNTNSCRQSWAGISDLGPKVAQDWSANVSIFVGRPVFCQYSWFWSNQCTDLCWPAGFLPVFLILVQPKPKIAGQCIDLRWSACPLQYSWSWCNRGQRSAANVSIHVGRPVFCGYFWTWSNRGQRLAGQCIDLFWPANVPIYVGRPVFCRYFWSWSNRGQRLAGQCIDLF